MPLVGGFSRGSAVSSRLFIQALLRTSINLIGLSRPRSATAKEHTRKELQLDIETAEGIQRAGLARELRSVFSNYISRRWLVISDRDFEPPISAVRNSNGAAVFCVDLRSDLSDRVSNHDGANRALREPVGSGGAEAARRRGAKAGRRSTKGDIRAEPRGAETPRPCHLPPRLADLKRRPLLRWRPRHPHPPSQDVENLCEHLSFSYECRPPLVGRRQEERNNKIKHATLHPGDIRLLREPSQNTVLSFIPSPQRLDYLARGCTWGEKTFDRADKVSRYQLLELHFTADSVVFADTEYFMLCCREFVFVVLHRDDSLENYSHRRLTNNSHPTVFEEEEIWTALNIEVLRADWGDWDPRENPPTNGIVRHDSHMRKSGVTRPGIELGSPWWEASRLTAQPPCSPSLHTLLEFNDSQTGHKFDFQYIAERNATRAKYVLVLRLEVLRLVGEFMVSEVLSRTGVEQAILKQADSKTIGDRFPAAAGGGYTSEALCTCSTLVGTILCHNQWLQSLACCELPLYLGRTPNTEDQGRLGGKEDKYTETNWRGGSFDVRLPAFSDWLREALGTGLVSDWLLTVCERMTPRDNFFPLPCPQQGYVGHTRSSINQAAGTNRRNPPRNDAGSATSWPQSRYYTISDSVEACASSAIAAIARAREAPAMAFPALHGQISYQLGDNLILSRRSGTPFAAKWIKKIPPPPHHPRRNKEPRVGGGEGGDVVNPPDEHDSGHGNTRLPVDQYTCKMVAPANLQQTSRFARWQHLLTHSRPVDLQDGSTC
ncbi:hypothetical protein PR048_000298 [Dryococelus australis]|uniref:Uncharacterized protein n=1 Tax=Dryococelus australis TaxID=614101 RepID=A0ABQ9IE96_9NEOP|nr:hypothetical protein PR048_000298 [Dryococelus australis]